MTNRRQMPIWGGGAGASCFIYKGIGPSLNHGNIRFITLKLDFFQNDKFSKQQLHSQRYKLKVNVKKVDL